MYPEAYYKKRALTAKIARTNGMTTDALSARRDELLADAKADLRSGQIPQANTVTSDHTATHSDCPF